MVSKDLQRQDVSLFLVRLLTDVESPPEITEAQFVLCSIKLPHRAYMTSPLHPIVYCVTPCATWKTESSPPPQRSRVFNLEDSFAKIGQVDLYEVSRNDLYDITSGCSGVKISVLGYDINTIHMIFLSTLTSLTV